MHKKITRHCTEDHNNSQPLEYLLLTRRKRYIILITEKSILWRIDDVMNTRAWPLGDEGEIGEGVTDEAEGLQMLNGPEGIRRGQISTPRKRT